MTGGTGAWFPAAELPDGAAAPSANTGGPKARANPETRNIVRNDDITFSLDFPVSDGEHRGPCLCDSSHDRDSGVAPPLQQAARRRTPLRVITASESLDRCDAPASPSTAVRPERRSHRSELSGLGMIGVDQPPDLAVQHLELALDARALALVGAVDGGIAAALLEARPQEGRIGQQPADPMPDLLLERPGRGAPAITGARGVARVAGRADVTVPAAVRGADHAPATPAADQQRAQQIPAPGVVPCGAFAVAGQLLLGQAPKLGIDDGGHRHRDPLLHRPEGLAAPIARAEILEAGLAARLDPIRRAPAIVPALALVARVRQDPDHGALRPAAPAAPAGRHPALDQAPLDRVGTQLLLDQPAVQLAHHRRFALLDDG